MAHGHGHSRPRNLVLVAFLALGTLFAAFHEGYISLISRLFWASLLCAVAMAVWLAWQISTRRLLSLMLGIFLIEYVKETIGIRSKMWTYHGINGQYLFGVWAWVLGGIAAYTLATRLLVRLVRRAKLSPPRWVNPVCFAAISLLIPSTLGEYRNGAGGLFYSFYALLFAVGIYASAKMDFSVFAAIVLSAWLVGNPSEYVGSASSGVWTFTHNPTYPPFFLLFGCWPVEVLAQYSLSAFLADEPLDKDISSVNRGEP